MNKFIYGMYLWVSCYFFFKKIFYGGRTRYIRRITLLSEGFTVAPEIADGDPRTSRKFQHSKLSKIDPSGAKQAAINLPPKPQPPSNVTVKLVSVKPPWSGSKPRMTRANPS